MVTETDRVAAALDDAARRWPEDADDRPALLHHLLAAGHQAIGDDIEVAATARRRVVDRTAGALTGSYGEGYLDELREEWPS